MYNISKNTFYNKSLEFLGFYGKIFSTKVRIYLSDESYTLYVVRKSASKISYLDDMATFLLFAYFFKNLNS